MTLLVGHPVVFTEMETNQGFINVLRDDILTGGTKSRAAYPYISALKREGYTSVSYASPFCGFAQLAVADACKHADMDFYLFAEVDPITKRPHTITKKAAKLGAKVYPHDNLDIAIGHANTTKLSSLCFNIPLGLDTIEYKNLLSNKVHEVFEQYLSRYVKYPPEVWVCVGSGTLLKTIRKVLPKDINLIGVSVNVLDFWNDSRMREIKTELDNTYLFASDRDFHTPCHESLIPSNIYYDAKVWSFVREYAANGSLWWNVAA